MRPDSRLALPRAASPSASQEISCLFFCCLDASSEEKSTHRDEFERVIQAPFELMTTFGMSTLLRRILLQDVFR